MNKRFTLLIQKAAFSLALTMAIASASGQNINEFHYDNVGVDQNQFVEVFFPDPQPVDLTQYVVTRYNGSNGMPYGTTATLAVMTATPGTGGTYYVWYAGLQNGAPDGIALSGPGGLIEFWSYEGTFTAIIGPANGVTSTDVGVSESSSTPVGSSLAWDGTQWVVLADDNPGQENFPPPPCSITSITLSNISACNDQGTAATDDDTFTFDVTINYQNPPTTGNLVLELYDINNNLISTQNLAFDPNLNSVMFTGLSAGVIDAADKTITAVAHFSDDPACTFTNTSAGTAPGPCSSGCGLNLGSVAKSCVNQGTACNGDDQQNLTFLVNNSAPGPSNQFTVTFGGNTYGPYAYGMSHTINNIPPTLDTAENIVFTDVDDATCFDIIVFDLHGCSQFDAPAVNAIGDSICFYQDLQLLETGGDGTSWNWTGPNGFTSTDQNPLLVQPPYQVSNGWYYVTVTAPGGCTAVDSTYSIVYPLPAVDILTSDTSVCENSGSFPIQAIPDSGYFIGPFVDATGNFDVNAAGPGAHQVIYGYSNIYRCDNFDTITVTVLPAPVVSAGGYGFPCLNDPPITLYGGTPPGGTFSGPGVVGNTFDPSVAGVGPHDVIYTYTDANGCTGTDTTTIEVLDIPDAPTVSDITVCYGDSATITPTLGGGGGPTTLYSQTFDTDGYGAVGPQPPTITNPPDASWQVNGDLTGLTATSDYFQTIGGQLVARDVDGEVCFQTAAINISGMTNVSLSVDISETGDHEATDYVDVKYLIDGTETKITNWMSAGDANHTLIGDVLIGGTPDDADWGSTTVTAAGLSGNTMILSVCVFNNAGSENIYIDNVSVTGEPAPMTATFNFYDADPNTPGANLLANNVTSYTVAPATMTQTIWVTTTSPNGCDSDGNPVTITVNPLPTPDAGTYPPVCVNEPVTLSGSPAGGSFSGTGVTASTFQAATPGTYDIYYTYTDSNGCTATDTSSITVNALPTPDAGTYAAVCLNAPVVSLTGTPAGGSFSGPGVSGSSFNPADAGVGNHTITYAYTDSNGCTGMDTATIEVLALPPAPPVSDIEVCEGDSTLISFPGGGPVTTTVFSETFDEDGAGAVGPQPPTVTPPSNGQWSITGDLSGLTATSDFFRTSGGQLTARDVDATICFETQDINITGMPDVGFSIDISETGDHEASDFVDVTYILDGTPTTITNWMSAGDATHTLIGDVLIGGAPDDADWGSTTVTASGLTGSTLKLQVCVMNNAGSEFIHLDNVTVTSTAPATVQYNFYDGDPNMGGNLLAGPVDSYDPGTTPATSPQQIWVTSFDGTCESDPVMMTVTVHANPVITAASNSIVCQDSTLLLTATGGDSTMTWMWSGPNGFTSSDQNPVVPGATPDMSGTYQVIGTNGFGCVDTATTDVSIEATPPAPVIADIQACPGDTVTIDLSLPTTPQPIFTETFDENGIGLQGPCPGGNCTNNSTPSNGQWTLTGDVSGLTATSDFFQTNFGFLTAQDVDQELCFLTQEIDISNYTDVSFSIDIFENGDHEASDYVDVTLIVDGTPMLITNWNGLGSATHTLVGDIPDDGDWVSTTVTQSGITGSTLQIQVCVLNNAGSEDIILDNVLVSGIPTTGSVYNFYDADPADTSANLLAAGVNTFDVVPQLNDTFSVWVTCITPTGCVSPPTEVQVTAFQPPVVADAELINCMVPGTSAANFTLEEAIPDITQGVSGLNVSFYASMADAMTGTNPVSSPYNSAGDTLFAAVVDSNGCQSIAQLVLTPFNCTVDITDPCSCATYGQGAFLDSIKITAPAGQTWTVSAVSGLTINGIPVPLGMPIPEMMPGMYGFVGTHYSGYGYSLSVTNENGITLTTQNKCYYPDPVIEDLQNFDQFCLNTPPFPLKGNAGGVDGTGIFYIDGTQDSIFDPSALGIGSHTVVYEFDAGTATPFDPNDPGCTASASVTVQVIQTPSALSCVGAVQISLNENCQVALDPSMFLLGNYGCWDDYEVNIIDNTGQPLGNIADGSMTSGTWAVMVTHLPSGTSCWVPNVTFADKTPPTISCGEPQPVTTISGEIDPADPTWTRPFVNNSGICNPSNIGVGVSYETFTFTISQPDTYTFSMPSIVGPDFFAALYQGPFDPTQPCNNLLATDDDTNGTEPEIVITLTLAPGDYTLVTTTFAPDPNAGPYSYNVSSANGGQVQIPAGQLTVNCTDDLDALTAPVPSDNCDPNPSVTLIGETYLDDDMCDDNQMVLQRTWIAIDNQGMQSAPCTQTITIKRAPVSFPEDITWTCDQYAAHPNIIDPNALHPAITDWDPNDNQNDIDVNPNMSNYILANTGSGVPAGYQGGYCNFNVEHIDQIYDHCGNGTFKIHRKWIVTDMCTYEITYHTQVIVVGDITGPQFDFTQAPFQTNNAGGIYLEVSANEYAQGYNYCSSTDFVPAPPVSDNCSGVDLSSLQIFTPVGQVTNINPSGGYIPAPGLPVGVYPDGLTYRIADACGNITEQSITLVVKDDIPPVMVCQDSTKVSLTSDGQGLLYADASLTEDSYDNCGIDHFEIRRMEDPCNITGNTTFDNSDDNGDGALEPNDSYTDPDQGTYVTFCCNDLGSTHTVVLRAYDVYGNYNECMVDVTVEDKQPPQCFAPADVTVACYEFDPTLWPYGDATGADNCDFTITGPVVSGSVDNCNSTNSDGTDNPILRTWTVTDASGQTATCTQKITVNYVQNFKVKFPNDQTLTTCGALTDTIFPQFMDKDCELAGYSYVDEQIDLTNVPGADACYKIIRHWTIYDWCDFDLNYTPTPVANPDYTDQGPTVQANSNNHGYFTYDQIIKVSDSEPPVITGPASPLQVCDYTTNCAGDAYLSAVATDACSKADLEFNYTLYLDMDGDGTMETVIHDTDAGAPPVLTNANGDSLHATVHYPGMPLGTHKIKWIVYDHCGQSAVYEYNIEVKDCKKPTIVVDNGISVNLMNVNGGMVTVYVGDPANCNLPQPDVCGWDPSVGDNCTPDSLLDIRIRKAGTGTGVPAPSSTSVTFTCDDLDTNYVEIWVGDQAGNWDYTVTYAVVTDSMNICNSAPIAGAITMHDSPSTGVQDVTVTATQAAGNIPPASTVTPSSGDYSFAGLPLNEDYTITPYRDGDDANGVNVLDLLYIYQYILGAQPFESPYQKLAADVNQDGVINISDLLIIRQLTLGVIAEFPNTTSWRFYKADCDADTTTCPEYIDIVNLQSPVADADFKAVKMGDVTGDAAPNAYALTDNRSFGRWVLNTANRYLRRGDVIRVPITADREDIVAYQFTLRLDGVEFVDVQGPQVSFENNFALHDKALAVSWTGTPTREPFVLTLRATRDGWLSDALQLDGSIAKAMAFDRSEQRNDVLLAFDGKLDDSFRLYQNIPNPFSSETTIRFYLPEATPAKLTVLDINGRVIKTIEGRYAKGMNRIILSLDEPGLQGVLYYQLDTPEHSAIKKMIILR